MGPAVSPDLMKPCMVHLANGEGIIWWKSLSVSSGRFLRQTQGSG